MLTLTAGHVVFQEHQVAFFEAFSCGEVTARLGDVANVFVAHDDGPAGERLLVHLHVGAANARHFHLQQCAVGGHLRHGEFAQLHLAGAGFDGGQNGVHGSVSIVLVEQKFKQPRLGCFGCLTSHGHVPVLGAGQTFFKVARGRRGV